MYELQEMIVSTLDLSNYIPKQKLYDDYVLALDNALELYKQNNKLEEITEDIVNAYGEVVLSVEMQEINRDFNIKQGLKDNVKIEITEDNLSDYFEEKPKTEIELLKEQLAAQDEVLQTVLFDLLPNMEGGE